MPNTQLKHLLYKNFGKHLYTLQIPNSLGDKFSYWDSQNEALITHYEKKNRNHAKCFLFWKNHVSLRRYLIELSILS